MGEDEAEKKLIMNGYMKFQLYFENNEEILKYFNKGNVKYI